MALGRAGGGLGSLELAVNLPEPAKVRVLWPFTDVVQGIITFQARAGHGLFLNLQHGLKAAGFNGLFVGFQFVWIEVGYAGAPFHPMRASRFGFHAVGGFFLW